MKTHTPLLHQQRGVTLVVVLIMLMIVTLLGISSIRGSTQQERMVTGFYDRSLAMQSAEAAMHSAFKNILKKIEDDSHDLKIVNCIKTTPSGSAQPDCSAVPLTTFSGDDGNWNTLTDYTPNKDLVAGVPQFYIQSLGPYDGGDSSIINQGDQDHGYKGHKTLGGGGGGGGGDGVAYRITARSANPANKNVDGRSLVVLSGITR